MRTLTNRYTRHWLLMPLILLISLNARAAGDFTLKVGYLPILDHLTLLVSHARDNDSFSRVNVRPRLFKSWGEMVGALRAGRIDAAFILSPLAMDLYNQGVDVRTIMLAHRDGSAITVKKGSPIHSAADLRGKSVAIPARKSTHTALLHKYLTTGGLTLKDIHTKVIAPPNMIRAMMQNRIDAFIVAEPFGAKAQKQGLGEILVLTKDIVDNHVECIVIIKQDLLAVQGAAVQEWVSSLLLAGRFIDQDKLGNDGKEVAALTAKKYFPHDQATVKEGLLNPKDRISFSDLDPVAEDFQVIVDISKEAGILDAVNLGGFIEPRFYQTAAGTE